MTTALSATATLHEQAAQLDADDTLADLRTRFLLPPDVVYLDGNSLGPLPAAVPAALDDVVRRQWATGLIGSWNAAGWWQAPLRVGDTIGTLIGAAPGQTIAGDSTSVQLFTALDAAAALRPDRPLLVTDPRHFPTDRYLADAVARRRDLDVRHVRPADLPHFLAAEGERVAVVSYAPVDYRTGELYDMRTLTRAAHDAGALALWDLCHAAGALPLDVDGVGVDLAVGCGYKFLSGGPGAPAFLYVAQRHHPTLETPLPGWTGHADSFALADSYTPAPGLARARIGTPPILSLLALGSGPHRLRQRRPGPGPGQEPVADGLLPSLRGRTPGPAGLLRRHPGRRGSQVTLSHRHARGLAVALAESGVIADMRAPDLLRFGVNALYTSHRDMLTAASRLRALTEEAAYDPAPPTTGPVT
ncbi:aminotransferase class V-fold PLP-dependent enzyme [Streptomyces pseudovenezuelae]|nr:aminotransferase class V-fold PLP-dependent enzyme [Streptomyces pseudovenezuelae]